MNNKEFKEGFIKNLRDYLPSEYKLCKINMRKAKTGERCYYDDNGRSVRKVVHNGIKYRIEISNEINNLDNLIYFSMYKTVDVNWEYKGKN